MDVRNSAEKNPSSAPKKKPLNFEICIAPNTTTNTFSSTNQPKRPLGLRSEWRPGMPWDPDWGEAPGSKLPAKTKGNPLGRVEKGETLADLIQMALNEKVDVYYGSGKMERIERRRVWAQHLVDIAVYGQVILPSPDPSGGGRVVKFSADSYSKYALKMLRYLEPPTPEVINPAGVTNIIFDIPIQVPVQVMETTSKTPEITIIDHQPEGLPSPKSS
jgi:hypothetical protein